jgi:hypothetical protein
VVATVLFLWWSIYAIPSLLSIGSDQVDDEAELNFDEVKPNQTHSILGVIQLMFSDHPKRKIRMASMLSRYRDV